MNSVFVQSSIYSYAVDCFLELLFTTAFNYRNQGRNSSCLPAIREPVWLYLRERCSTFQARDCNASFSQIFEEKTLGNLSPKEVSLFASQRLFETFCSTCNENVTFNSRIFLTYISQPELRLWVWPNFMAFLFLKHSHSSWKIKMWCFLNINSNCILFTPFIQLYYIGNQDIPFG